MCPFSLDAALSAYFISEPESQGVLTIYVCPVFMEMFESVVFQLAYFHLFFLYLDQNDHFHVANRLKVGVQGSSHARISWSYWFKRTLYYQVAIVYVLTRLIVNVSQVRVLSIACLMMLVLLVKTMDIISAVYITS